MARFSAAIAHLSSCFADRRPLVQIGGLRGYLTQIYWSLRFNFGRSRRLESAGHR